VVGIKEVRFFLGKPAAGNKVPENVASVLGERSPANGDVWQANLPLPADKKGPVEVSVLFVNNAGLVTAATERTELDENDPNLTKPATIKGTLRQGALAQGGMKVVLTDEKGAARAEQMTKADGTFEFAN